MGIPDLVLGGRDSVCGEICRALGLDPKVTRSVVLDMTANDIVTITVKSYPTREEIEKVGGIIEHTLEEYVLISRKALAELIREKDAGKPD